MNGTAIGEYWISPQDSGSVSWETARRRSTWM